jgi:hypothetical protein
MPAPLQVARWTEQLRSLFGVKQATGGVLLEDVFPTAPLYDPTAPEIYRLRGERLWVAAGSVTSAAGQLPRLKIQVPPPDQSGNGILSVLEYVVVANSVADRLQILSETFVAAGGNGARERDLRAGVGPGVRVGTLFLLDSPGGLGGNLMSNVQLAAGISFEFRPAIIMAPNTQVNLMMTVPGVSTMVISAYGRERSVEPSEVR